MSILYLKENKYIDLNPMINQLIKYVDNVVCTEPKAATNDVTLVTGHVPHLYSEVNVTCNHGMHFVGE